MHEAITLPFCRMLRMHESLQLINLLFAQSKSANRQVCVGLTCPHTTTVFQAPYGGSSRKYALKIHGGWYISCSYGQESLGNTVLRRVICGYLSARAPGPLLS